MILLSFETLSKTFDLLFQVAQQHEVTVRSSIDPAGDTQQHKEQGQQQLLNTGSYSQPVHQVDMANTDRKVSSSNGIKDHGNEIMGGKHAQKVQSTEANRLETEISCPPLTGDLDVSCPALGDSSNPIDALGGISDSMWKVAEEMCRPAPKKDATEQKPCKSPSIFQRVISGSFENANAVLTEVQAQTPKQQTSALPEEPSSTSKQDYSNLLQINSSRSVDRFTFLESFQVRAVHLLLGRECGFHL